MTVKNTNAPTLPPKVVIDRISPAYASIVDWCRLTGMGRSTTYEALGRGDLQAIKLGTRTLIDVAHGLAWLATLPVASVRLHGASRRKQAI